MWAQDRGICSLILGVRGLIFCPSHIAVVHPPPTSIQVLATERKALTVRWDPPSEIAPNLLMKCKLLLHDQLGNCTKVIIIYNNNNIKILNHRLKVINNNSVKETIKTNKQKKPAQQDY